MDDSPPFFLLCEKGFGVYVMVYVPRVLYCMVASVGGNGDDVNVEGRETG
jgi:hypothetical protein